MKGTFKSISENVKVMTPRTKQREIKKITSNLPEVYNKYFFTVDKDGTKHMQQQPITNLKKPFSLNQNQKQLQNAEQQQITSTNVSLGQNSQNKSVFQKTPRGVINVYSRKVSLGDELPVNPASDGEDASYALDSPTKSYLTKQNIMVTPDEGRQTEAKQQTLYRGSKIDESDFGPSQSLYGQNNGH